ncbi:MAG: N-acetylmuramoyl-L-alanine amidase [Roseburia sp.]|nr:N-acetylmuramoyl-L-alanine amidase [Roseburia sp.]
MNRLLTTRQKKKLLRNLISIVYCCFQLAIVIVAIKGATHLLGNYMKNDVVEALVGEKEISTEEKEIVENAKDDGLVVCVDAGHGGKDDGSDYRKRLEKNDNLNLALALQSYLESQGATVVMTRTDDTFLKLSERCEIANNANADYFVALHRNKGEGCGIENWIYTGENEETQTLAENINAGLVAVGVQKDRGVKKGTQKGTNSNYYINNHSHMPSCILELGFMNSEVDNELYDEHLNDYAKAIGDAIIATYTSFGGQMQTASNDQDSNQTEGTEADTADVSTETINNPVIESVESLDATCQNWGQGSQVDEQNRPLAALSFQEKYKDYSVAFIGEGEHTIYLTFDEGYEYGQTTSILDTLKEKNVHAVFFVTEPYAKAEPELVQRMIDEGHEVGNHSVTHPADGLPSKSLEEQKEEVMGNDAYIKEQFGYQMRLFRFPAGKFSDQSLAIVNNCNYKSVFWSFAYVDYDVNNQPNQAESLQKLKDKMHPGAIYLLHAESSTNAAILGDFIDAAIAAGYEFGSL